MTPGHMACKLELPLLLCDLQQNLQNSKHFSTNEDGKKKREKTQKKDKSKVTRYEVSNSDLKTFFHSVKLNKEVNLKQTQITRI